VQRYDASGEEKAMDRSNHYEAAFEAFLREKKVGFLAVDEAKRSLLGGESIKSLDFVVVGPETSKLVVDVKGRKFPGGTPGKPPRKVWQNWSTRDDVEGISRWAGIFGSDFRGILAFVYHILPIVEMPPGTPDLFVFRDRTYLMRGIEVEDYQRLMKPRSEKWGTVALPVESFRSCIQPFSAFLEIQPGASNEPRPKSIQQILAEATKATKADPIPD